MTRTKTIKEQSFIKDKYTEISPKKKVGTTYDEKKKDKKEILENYERIEAMGQVNEKKGIKFTQEDLKQDQKKDYNIEATESDWLSGKRKYTDQEYLTSLGSVLYNKLEQIDLPLGYRFTVEIEGVRMKASLIDRFGREFVKGIKVSGEVKYDYHAIKVIAEEAENTVENLEGSDEARKTKNGIYLPPSVKL